MPRVRETSLNRRFSVIVSLMLAGITLAIWITGRDGYFRIYDSGWNADRTHVCYSYGSFEFEHKPAGTPQYCHDPSLAPAWSWSHSSQFGTKIRFPIWVPLILFSIIPSWSLLCIPLRARRRRACNQCVKCGYNLAGLPKPRCPECGAADRIV